MSVEFGGKDRTSDTRPGHWVERMPRGIIPYLRLARVDRPIGTWLLLLPCWWGLSLGLAAEGWTFRPLFYAFLFAVGAVVMRGAGCTYNDIVDRDIDARVARTRNRPLPSGAIGLSGAWAFLVIQAFIGLGVLLCFNSVTVALGIASLALVAAYPFAKRITSWPQAVLGLTFNWGVLMGYAALTETLHAPALLLYGAGLFWTLGYDTIYAHQDKEDDALIGVKSTALLFGARTKAALTAFYSLCVILLGAAGWTAELGVGFWFGTLAVTGHFVWQIAALRIDEPENCLRLFRANRDAGLIVLAALLAGVITA